MSQISLTEAQNIIMRIVENPDGSKDLTDRQIAEACAVVLVRNELLASGGLIAYLAVLAKGSDNS